MKRISFLILVSFAACQAATSQPPVALFNGKDLTGWHADVPELDTARNATFPFLVRDGKLVSLGTPQGHLITDATYTLLIGILLEVF